MKSLSNRLVIVSNRLPIICEKNEHAQWEIEASSGGLVTALDPVFKHRGGVWIGWPGTTEASLAQLREPLKKANEGLGYELTPVALSEVERDQFYLGFSNAIIWPLFHDLQTRCHFDPKYFRTYEEVNKKFARTILNHTQANDLIWIQDYHLMGVAKELRQMGVKNRLAFFLHIPFPPLDIFLKLPWRREILSSLMEFDTLGFQTTRDVRNFMQCVRMLLLSRLDRREGNAHAVRKISYEDREVAVGAFPISIDFEDFATPAADPKIAQKAKHLREDLPHRTLALGIDRLDYTKGIPYKLEAFRNALERYPELRGNLTLVQNVVPSRESITEYHDLRIEIEQLVGEINGQYSRAGWVPIHYKFHHMDREELLAYYRMAAIALVTPLKDGMNLVAKEFCACDVEENSVLILSEFAGAAAEFQDDALLVNPYNVEEIADKIYLAYKMEPAEKKERMQALRKQIKEHDIEKWAESFLKEALTPHQNQNITNPEANTA